MERLCGEKVMRRPNLHILRLIPMGGELKNKGMYIL